jgi:hypothetical protein
MSLFLRHPLVWIAVLIAATIATLTRVTELQQQGTFDPLMLLLMVTSYTAAFVSVAVRTPWRSWTILGAGLAATFLADALIWAYVFLTRVNADGEWAWSHGPEWLNATHAAFIPHTAVALIVIRALFVVGGVFVLVGLIRDSIVDMRIRRSDSARTREDIARIGDQLTAISQEARSAARDAATEAMQARSAARDAATEAMEASDERTRIMLADAAKQETLLEVKTIVEPLRSDNHEDAQQVRDDERKGRA